MAGTDGVEPVTLHQLHAALLGAVNRRGAQYAVVVMQAAALEFDRLAIDAQTARCVHMDGAHAKRH